MTKNFSKCQYLESADWSLVIAKIALDCNFDIFKVLQSGRLSLPRLNPDNWQDLEFLFRPSLELFEELNSEPIYLINIGNLSFNEDLCKRLSENQNLPILYFFSIQKDLNTDEKKIWKKYFVYHQLKQADEKIKNDLAVWYSQQLNLNLSAGQMRELIKNSDFYNQIIDNLDFLSLSENIDLALEQIQKPIETGLFIYGFDPNKLKLQVPNWLKNVNEDNLQLAFSLVFGKLEKSSDSISPKLQQNLIKIDQKIKTRSKISPLLWWKLFLWQSLNSQNTRF